VVTGAVLYQVLRKGHVTAHRVGGAIAVYLMLGLIWASAYSLLFIDDPASFDLGRPIEATDELSEIQTKGTSRLVYFSFVTMTTLGYGDVTPRSEAAGTLAILQALTGQIYLAVILARIVSLLVTRPDEE
jgi:voltage-gated potassium channel Kch